MLAEGDRVRRRARGLGTISQVFSRDWANMTDTDVAVEWDDGELTHERADDLRVVSNA